MIKVLKDFNKFEGYYFRMIKSRVCADVNVVGRGIFWEEKIIFFGDGDRVRRKKKNCFFFEFYVV